MNCYNHPELTIVATCQDCFKGLCNECAKNYETPICVECNNLRYKREKINIHKKLLNLLIACIVGGVIGNMMFSTTKGVVFGIIFGVILYSGWRQTNKVTPQMFLHLPLIGWLLYFAIKFSVSLVIGIITAPLEILNAIRKHFLIKKRQG